MRNSRANDDQSPPGSHEEGVREIRKASLAELPDVARVMENRSRELLLALLRAAPITEPKPDIWPAVATLARAQRIGPLLYWRLQSAGLTGQVPADLLQQWRSVYLQSAERNVRLYHELRGWLQQFGENNIPAIPLKGAYLAERIYGNIAVRPMGDVDILVRKADLSRIQEIMEESGFSRTDRLRETASETHHFVWWQKATGSHVEIHWDLISAMYGIRFDLDGLWARTRPTLVAGTPVYEMSPEDQALHLCVHASSHVFDMGLTAVCDLAETLQHYRECLDWDSIRERAHLWHAERCLYLNLRLAAELLSAPMPSGWPEEIRPADFESRYLTIAQQRLFASQEEAARALPESPEFARFWSARRTSQKLRVLWHSLFPSRQTIALEYPETSPESLRILLYYPVRMKDQLRRIGRIAWHLGRNDVATHVRAQRQDQVNSLRDWLLAVDSE